MPELLRRHKLRLGETRLERDDIAFPDDIKPSLESAAVQSFVAALSAEPPLDVPLQGDDENGMYGWPADRVREKIATHGGSIRFGWRLREWPGILLTAEFHAVWIDPDGAFIDITSDLTGGNTSLFVPDSSYPETFDFDQRPPTRYKVLHTAPDWSAAVAERIARMKPVQRSYEERRAQKARKSLEEWIFGKFPADSLSPLIDAFIEACKAYDARLPELPDLIKLDPHPVADADDIEVPPESEAPFIAADEPVVPNPDDTHADETHGVLSDTGDAPAEEMVDDADDGSAEDDDLDTEFDEEWGLIDEGFVAEQEIIEWSTPRFYRRQAILRAMPQE